MRSTSPALSSFDSPLVRPLERLRDRGTLPRYFGPVHDASRDYLHRLPCVVRFSDFKLTISVYAMPSKDADIVRIVLSDVRTMHSLFAGLDVHKVLETLVFL